MRHLSGETSLCDWRVRLGIGPKSTVGKINRYASENEVVVVPGKLLGAGEIEKKVTVAAYRSSGQARDKIEKAGGKSLSIEELVAQNPKGSRVRIMR